MPKLSPENIQEIKDLLAKQEEEMECQLRHIIESIVWNDDQVEQYLNEKFDDITEEDLSDTIDEYNLRDLQHDIISSVMKDFCR